MLTENDARALAALAPLGPFDLLDSDDASVVPQAMRERLVNLLSEYRMIHGRQVATRGAAALNDWLIAKSVVPQLRSVLASQIREFADLRWAGRIIGELDRLACTHPTRQRIRDIVDRLRSDLALHTVMLFGHLKAILAADPPPRSRRNCGVWSDIRRWPKNSVCRRPRGFRLHRWPATQH